MDDLIDAIMPVNPEPCETCETGIEYITCWDGRKRCRNCVQDYARKMGWDKMELSDVAAEKAERAAKRSLLSDPAMEWNPRSTKGHLPPEPAKPNDDPSLGI